jgi:hypothetical protein
MRLLLGANGSFVARWFSCGALKFCVHLPAGLHPEIKDCWQELLANSQEGKNMKDKLLSSSLLLIFFLILAPTALASSLWYVDGVHGNDQNSCRTPVAACKTIGHAVSLASSGDSIFVAGATYPENLTINFSLSVVGAGAMTTIVDGRGVNTVVTIPNASAHVNLSNVTIRGGHSERGGGIFNAGTLAVNNSTVSGNTALISCNNFCLAWGGGIFSEGTLIINNSTVSGNSVLCTGHGCHVTLGGGIAINTSGTSTINSSTISGNNTNGRGGGIGVYISGAMTINSSTISGNAAANVGGVSVDSATIQNSIVSNNTGGNCGGTIRSNGYNMSSDGTCSFHSSGDLNNTDPMLGPLQNNGGPTLTQALLDGSPAIDGGNPSGCTDGNGHLLTTDQRGYPRPDHEDTGGCDMGAYERQMD